MSDLEKMTRKSQEAMQAAALSADKQGHPSVEPEHLLKALLAQSEGVVPRLLSKINVKAAILLEDIDNRLKKLPQVTGSASK
ncbi:MAG: Clp protease N-terminal domain-containing protein, partial [bacterium]